MYRNLHLEVKVIRHYIDLMACQVAIRKITRYETESFGTDLRATLMTWSFAEKSQVLFMTPLERFPPFSSKCVQVHNLPVKVGQLVRLGPRNVSYCVSTNFT